MEYETQEELMRQEGELLESSPVSTGKKAKTFIAKKRVPISEVADGTVEKPEPDTSGEEVKANTTGPVGDVTQHTPGVYEDAATLVKSGGDAYIGGTVLPNSKVRAKLRPADQYSNDPFWLESRDRFVPTGDWTVNLSFLEKPAKITTSDINKGVYQIATEHLAAAPEDFFGYEYQPWAPEKETWVSAFTSEFEKATGDTMANTWNAINNFLDSDTIVSPEKRAELNRKTGGWIRRKGQQILDYYSELEPMERGRGAEIAGIAGSGTASMLPTFVAAPFVLAGGWAGALAAVGGRLGTAMMSAHEALGTQDAALKAGMTPKEAQRAGLKHFGAIATTETVLGGAADILGAGVMRAAITRGASRSLLFALGVGTGAASGVVSSVGEVYQDKAGLIASKQAGLEILGSWSRDDWNTFYGSLVTEALGIPGHMKGADTQIKKTEAEFNKYLAKGAMFKKILVDAAKAKGVELPQDVLDRIDQVIIDVWNNAERDLDADAKSIAQEIYDRTAEAIAEDPVVYEKAKALFEGGDAEALSKQAFTELDARMEKEVFTPDVTEEERKAYRAAVYATAMIGAYFFGSSPSNLRLPDIKNIKDSGGRFGPGTRAATEVAVGVNPETNQVEVPTFVVHSNRSGQNRDSDKGTYKKYRPSQRQNITDIMDFLHEMVHVQDWSIEFLSMLGDNPDNLNEFLDWFVEPVAEMYGKKRAKAVRSAAKKRVKEGKTVTGMFERAEYDSSDSSSEQRAHAIMFMANKALKHLGLEGNAANYVRAVNAMLMGMNEVTPMSSFVSEYLKDLKSYVDSNSKTIKKLRGSVSAQNMHAALKSYMGGNNNINWMGVNPSTIEEFAKAANKPLDKEALDYVIDSLGDIPIDDLINKVKRDYGTVFPEDSSQDVPTESERVQEKRMNEIETGEEESAIEDWDAPDTYTFASKGYAAARVTHDKPSTKSIGSGEGGKAHGWGLYYLLNKAKDFNTYMRQFSNVNNPHVFYKGEKLPKTPADTKDDVLAEVQAKIRNMARHNGEQVDGEYTVLTSYQMAEKAIAEMGGKANGLKPEDFVVRYPSKPQNGVIATNAVRYKGEGLGDKTDISIRDLEGLSAEELVKPILNKAFNTVRYTTFQERMDYAKWLVKGLDSALTVVEFEKVGSKLKEITKVLNSIKEEDIQVEQPYAQFAEAELPEINELLDENLTYSEQPENIKQALRAMLSDPMFDNYAADYLDAEDFANEEIKDWEYGFTGGNIYDRIANLVGEQTASELMGQYGIKGIYYDGRRDGLGIVVFNDENSEYTDVIFSAKSPEAESISDLVEEAKGQKKSEFWKKAHKQFNGRTLEQDMDAVAEAIKEHKFSNAGLTISLMRGTHAFLNALGGEKLDRMFDFVARYEDYTNNVMSSNRSLLQVLLPLFDGSLWKYENYVRDASVRKYTINYVDLSSGRTEQRTFSKRELLSAVLYDEQPDSHDRIRKTVDIDEIMQYLTEEDIAFAHALRDFLKDNYTKAKGEGAKKVPQNYWPIQDAYAQEKGNERIINDFGRKDTDAPIGLVDVMDVMGGYLSRVAGTQSGYFAAHRRLNSIINYNKKNQMDKAMTAEDMELNDRLDRKSTEIKKMIRERLGDARTKRLDGRIADVIKHRDEEDLRNAMLSQIARNITGTMLNGSAKQFSINSPNFLSYMGYEHTTIPKFVYGVAKAMVYFVRSYRLAMENESIKNRAEAYRFNEYMAKNLSANDDNMLTYLANYATRKDWNTGAAVADFMIHMGQLGKKMFASFTKYGDLVANIIGYAAVYESALEAFGGNVEMAKRDLARFMNERQSTANQAVKGLMVRETNRNAWYGSLFAFTGETTQKWGTIGQDINRMVSGDLSIAKGSRDITAQALPLIAYAAVASGLMLTVAMSLFGEKVSDDDWEKVYDNFFEQAFLQLAGMAGPWSNAVAEPALEQSVFGKKNSTLSIPFVSEIMKVTKDVGEGEYDDVLMHLISDFGVLNGAARGYTSIDGLVRMMSSNAKESRAGVWQASGRSEAYANYMAGIKKKKKSQKKSGGVSIK